MQTGLSLNAIWNSKDCSVTSYFQCRSCATQEQAHCYLMGAEILDLRANAKQQVGNHMIYTHLCEWCTKFDSLDGLQSTGTFHSSYHILIFTILGL